MIFYKYEGIGNDFIISEDLNNLEVIKLCDNHYGIGADGVILIDDIKDDLVSIRIYNKDGSEASTCGNGLRCVGAYLKDKYNKDNISVKTIASTYEVKWITNNEYEVSFPRVTNIKKEDNYYVVDSGNLHVLTIDKVDFESFIEKVIEKYDGNIELVTIIDRKNIEIRVNERGVGETLACGSGAIASVCALYKDNLVDNEVTCFMKGGTLNIKVERDKTYLKGDAKKVYKGEI